MSFGKIINQDTILIGNNRFAGYSTNGGSNFTMFDFEPLNIQGFTVNDLAFDTDGNMVVVSPLHIFKANITSGTITEILATNLNNSFHTAVSIVGEKLYIIGTTVIGNQATGIFVKTDTLNQFFEETILPFIGNGTGIQFVNENVGWITALNNTWIYKTTNGGVTWTQQITGLTNPPDDFYFHNENFGVVVAANSEARYTTDGGNTWLVASNLGLPQGLAGKLFFFNQNLGWYGTGNNGTIRRTTNGGISWQNFTTGENSRVNRVHFFNENQGVAATANNKLFFSNNGGVSWNFLYQMPVSSGSSSVGYIRRWDENTYEYIQRFEFPFKEFISTDGGISWNRKKDYLNDINDIAESNNFLVALHTRSISVRGVNNTSITTPPLDPPIVSFSISSNQICKNDSIFIQSNITGSYDSLVWSFGGAGLPDVNTENPFYITFNQSGNFIINLKVFYDSGLFIEKDSLISVIETPQIALFNDGNLIDNSLEICIGDILLISAEGADVFLFDGIENNFVQLEPTQNTTIEITAINGSLCSLSFDLEILVNIPDDLTLEFINDTIFTSGNFSQYEWSLNGNFLEITQESFLPIQTSGVYQCVAFDINDCSNFAEIEVMVSGIINQSVIDAKISPNPTTHFININMQSLPQNAVYSITDISGKILSNGYIISKNQSLDVSQLDTGFYFLRISDAKSGIAKVYEFIKK